MLGMMVRFARALWVVLLSGCGGWLVAFNECNPEKGELLGRTTVELDLRKTSVRSAEAPVGNLVADALLLAGREGCVTSDPPESARACPVIALENAGGIRNTTACGERDSIPVGSIHQADVDDMLPFATNEVVVVNVTGEELLLMLERSVSSLGQVGEAGAGGFFLQVSGLELEVDCAQAAQQLDRPNEQILVRGSRVDPARVVVGGAPLSLTAVYPVALNSFIAGARDGFLALALRDGADRVLKDANGNVRTKEKRFVERNGARISEAAAVRAYIESREGRVVAPRVEGRVVLRETCIPTE